MELITINLRGTIFMTDPNILKNVTSSSPLKTLNKECVYYIPARDEYFFNRNPAIFHNVLDYFMSGKLHFPSYVCAENIREELNFWGVPKGVVEKCCWKCFYQNDEDMSVLKKLLKFIPSKKKELESNLPVRSGDNSLKSRLWNFLNGPPTSLTAKMWRGFVFFAIIASMVTSVLFGFRDYRRDLDPIVEYPYEGHLQPTDKMMFYWNTTPVESILWTDTAANTFLFLEWILRLISCPSVKHFFSIFYNLTDIVSFVGSFFGLYFEVDNRKMFKHAGSYEIAVIVGLCYAARIFRIFRLLQHNVGMNILLLSLRSSVRELLVLTLSLVSISFMFGVVIMFAEITSHSASITDFVKGVWWAVITMTTVGYGDIHPTTEAGYFIGGLCAITGIILVALPVAVTSSNFYDFYTFNKYRMWFRRDQYEELLTRNKRQMLSTKGVVSREKSSYDLSACATVTDKVQQ